MSSRKNTPKYRLFYFISDLLQPWMVRNTEDKALRWELVGILRDFKEAIYDSGRF